MGVLFFLRQRRAADARLRRFGVEALKRRLDVGKRGLSFAEQGIALRLFRRPKLDIAMMPVDRVHGRFQAVGQMFLFFCERLAGLFEPARLLLRLEELVFEAYALHVKSMTFLDQHGTARLLLRVARGL